MAYIRRISVILFLLVPIILLSGSVTAQDYGDSRDIQLEDGVEEFVDSHSSAFDSGFSDDSESYQAQLDLPCSLQHAGGPRGRVLILIQGLFTNATSIEDQQADWSFLTQSELSVFYSDFVYFSYLEGSPESYRWQDTLQGLDGHHVPLLRSLIQHCHDEYGTDFESIDIIGHSLGGVIASEYIKKTLFDPLYIPQDGWIQHIITLDSPVNGSIAIPRFITEDLLESIPSPDLLSDLARMHSNRSNLIQDNKNMAMELRQSGIEYWTLTNNLDPIVLIPDATVDGSTLVYQLGLIRFIHIGDPIFLAQLLHSKIKYSSDVREDLQDILRTVYLDTSYSEEYGHQVAKLKISNETFNNDGTVSADLNLTTHTYLNFDVSFSVDNGGIEGQMLEPLLSNNSVIRFRGEDEYSLGRVTFQPQARLIIHLNKPFGFGPRYINVSQYPEDFEITVDFIEPPSLSESLVTYVGNDNHIWVVRPDGTGLRRLPIGGLDLYCPQFSPNGRYIAFDRLNQTTGVFQLILTELATGQSTVVMDDFGNSFNWSPDSSQIAFGYTPYPDYSTDEIAFYAQGVWVVDLPNGTPRPLIEPQGEQPLWVWDPRWSPDGSQIAFYEVERWEGNMLFRVATLDGNYDYIEWQTRVGSFDWSPDGSQIVFNEGGFYVGPTSGKLYIADPDSSNQRLIVNDSRYHIRGALWSPNGQDIAFIGGSESQATLWSGSTLWVVSEDGSNLRSVANTVDFLIDWSPDGTSLLVIDEELAKIVYLDGSTPLTLGSTGRCTQWFSFEQAATILEIFGDMEETVPTVDGTTEPAPTVQCLGAPVTRLQVGQQARQSLNRDSVLVRQNFDIDRYPFEIFPGEVIDVIGGPICHPTNSGQTALWWQVRNDQGQVGWAVEGVPGRYFFEPLNASQDTVTCPGTLPSRLIVGERARVLPGSPNRVRPEAGTNNEPIGNIPAGGEFSVLAGPTCANGYAWWQVDYDDLVGWTAEADSAEYWLEPLN